jgi:hypothetical protein
MDAGLTSAAVALGGAIIGGVLTFLSSWLIQGRAERAQWLSQDGLRRQDCYKEFVEEASKCLVNALQSDKPDLALVVAMYAKMSRMRFISSPQVLAAAEDVIRRIIEIYFRPCAELTRENVQEMLKDGSVDVLRRFGEQCRFELSLPMRPGYGSTHGVRDSAA